MCCEGVFVDFGDVAGDDAAESGRDADGSELGWVGRVLVEAEEVGVPKESSGGGGDETSVDEVEEVLEGGIDDGVVLVGDVDEDVEGVGVATFPFPAVGLADGLGDVPGQVVRLAVVEVGGVQVEGRVLLGVEGLRARS